MSNDRCNKEDVVYIYNGILLIHKKGQNWVICRDMDGPIDCHTEWTKSEKPKQILMYICGIWKKNWYRWSYLWSKNRHRYRECTDTKGEGGMGRVERLGFIHVYTIDTMYKIDN